MGALPKCITNMLECKATTAPFYMNKRWTIQRHYEEWSTAMAAYCIQEQMQHILARVPEVHGIDDLLANNTIHAKANPTLCGTKEFITEHNEKH